MKTPDEIKKGLECCADYGNCSAQGCPYNPIKDCGHDLYSDALAYIQQPEAAQPKWISVQERLPEIDPDRTWRCACEFSVDVVGFDGRNIFKAYYNFDDKVWLNGNIEEECHSITHWMYMDYLPEPQKEDA